MENKKVILAYSGGLDTSFCVKYLSEDQKLEVHTVTVNLGGFDEDELKDIEKNALGMGAAKHHLVDATAEYYRQCLRYLIYGNVLRNHIYPLSVSSERAFQAKVVALKAREIDARYVAHGSTGAGNDQVRFDLVFHTMIPGVEILTPIRDLRLSRQDEIEYLKKHGVKREWSKAKYSINKGLWGTSVGGEETKTSDKFLPGDAFPTQLETNDIEELEISFEKGEVGGFSGKKYSNSLDALVALGKHIAPYALGRDVHVGDTIIGIKGRIGFEAGLSLLVIRAHHLLEMHTLTKWQIYWKNQLSDWYGQMTHEGQFLAPVMRNIEGFLEDTQKYVTGSVICRLAPYRFQVLGIKSPHDLMSSDFGEYGEMNLAWSGEDVKGFTKIQAVPHMVYNKVNKIDESL
ncbi:MAG TPA: argininosuccinate synthase domain-containing protein [Cyclobacteriaceae bacterium]|nr:argininosuccinate synthase domain-containing protein [Cyclobacteriaceae bacterium]